MSACLYHVVIRRSVGKLPANHCFNVLSTKLSQFIDYLTDIHGLDTTDIVISQRKAVIRSTLECQSVALAMRDTILSLQSLHTCNVLRIETHSNGIIYENPKIPCLIAYYYNAISCLNLIIEKSITLQPIQISSLFAICGFWCDMADRVLDDRVREIDLNHELVI